MKHKSIFSLLIFLMGLGMTTTSCEDMLTPDLNRYTENFSGTDTVYFYNGSEKLQETRIYYGNYARYDGNEDEIKKIVGGVPSDYYEFASWSPSLDEPIT